jgi:hypothetical protein
MTSDDPGLTYGLSCIQRHEVVAPGSHEKAPPDGYAPGGAEVLPPRIKLSGIQGGPQLLERQALLLADLARGTT